MQAVGGTLFIHCSHELSFCSKKKKQSITLLSGFLGTFGLTAVYFRKNYLPPVDLVLFCGIERVFGHLIFKVVLHVFLEVEVTKNSLTYCIKKRILGKHFENLIFLYTFFFLFVRSLRGSITGNYALYESVTVRSSQKPG